MRAHADLGTLAPDSLRVLDLSANSLFGSLPAAWGSALRLSLLNLSTNLLNGTLPAAWVQVSLFL